jgi:hypothetical protein
VQPSSAAGVVFFNNGTYLGMCGHGSSASCARSSSSAESAAESIGSTRPSGPCAPSSADDGSVTIENVPARLHARDVSVEVPGLRRVTGDVAYGGNWFFITHSRAVPVDLAHVRELTRFTQAVQDAIRFAGITGADGADIDHIEISAPPSRSDADARKLRALLGGRLRPLAVRHGHVGDDGRAARTRSGSRSGSSGGRRGSPAACSPVAHRRRDGRAGAARRGTAFVTGRRRCTSIPAIPSAAGSTSR